MTKEDFSNLLRIKIASANKYRFNTNPGRLVNLFIQKDELYAFVYNEDMKKFQVIEANDITDVEEEALHKTEGKKSEERKYYGGC